MNRHPVLYAVTVLFILWTLGHYVVDPVLIPSPWHTIITLAGSFYPRLLLHTLASLGRIACAMGISVVIGGGIGIITGMSSKADRFISPLVYLIYPIPRIAFLPLFMLMLGLGNLSKIVLMVAVASFYLTIPIRDAIHNIPEEFTLAAKNLQLTPVMWFQHVVMPWTLPDFFTALKLALGTSIAALFFAETYATQYGLGYYIMNSWFLSDYTAMYAGITLLSIMGYLLFKAMDYVQSWMMPWKKL